MMYQLFCSLKYIHSAGIIHGDIRPSNILVNPDTSIRVTGFAYSSANDTTYATATTIPRTSTDTILYQAPEVLLGASKVRYPSIDVHSMLTHFGSTRLPTVSVVAETALRILSAAPQPSISGAQDAF